MPGNVMAHSDLHGAPRLRCTSFPELLSSFSARTLSSPTLKEPPEYTQGDRRIYPSTTFLQSKKILELLLWTFGPPFLSSSSSQPVPC
ncbi:hypothetical protein M758_2G033000 [Ceratodon purpureus]|uniref:Uncharacterized protein n=1 Tax=Ceratodon purpureus TaxID=3225 RepID=A0A8T0ISH1_CERPU|nr:hypothetical protein KC19_2G033800 [Ceratodon purpureus]KAG0625169.1 hypothetical protein M758_2G033000 [Ceratodon purpureus]